MLTFTRSAPRRVPIVLAVVAAAALQLFVLGAPAARAADPTTLNVVGTSDVFDSNLIQSVIKPGFEAKYPNFSLNYISKGSGAAIDYAEAGTADALVVHAASLENQFVQQGFSLEPYGRAIFWGDYVLLGPTADPAGVKADGSHDIVKAFQDIAKAGALGKADFVSRGGTPGTTVQEHKIWSLTSGVKTCTVSEENGGGTSPSTTTGACPTSISYPSWYHATGLTQGPNILNANTCNYGHGNDCYVLTDRGTYQYLKSQNPAPTKLSILTRGNTAAGALGGGTLLVNSFHAYAINPKKFPGTAINSVGATDLLNYITSPDGQAAIGGYLKADPPFIPDAAPKVTVSPAKVPGEVHPRDTITLTGSIANVVPGTPSLDKKRVTVMGQVTATPNTPAVAVASAFTDATGKYSISFQPPVGRTYTLETPALTKIEIPKPTLDPLFADQLQPTTTNLGTTVVQSALHQVRATGKGGAITVTGDVYPSAHGTSAVLRLYARVAGRGRSYHYVGGRALSNGQHSFRFAFPQAARKYGYFVRYVNPGFIEPAQSATRSVTVVS